MPLRVACPSCQASLKLDEKLAGRNLVCPSCRSGFRVSPDGNVPDNRDSPGDEFDLSESQLPPRLNVTEPESHEAPIKKYKRRRKKKQKRGRLDRAPLAVRGFALLLAGGLAASFVYLRPQGSETVPATTTPVSGSEQAGDSAESTPQPGRGSRSAQPAAALPAASPSAEFQNADPNDRFQIIWAPRHTGRSAQAQ
jgi:hypothetical protein